MFRETLLESSPMSHRNKRWPMATAFVIELIIAGVLGHGALLTTGVLPVLAHVADPTFTPMEPIKIEHVHTANQPLVLDLLTGVSHTTAVTMLANNPNQLQWATPQPTTDNPPRLIWGPVTVPKTTGRSDWQRQRWPQCARYRRS